jgi:multidrug efflux pump subunit AcrA (membrane-fusion protein)
MTRSSKFGAIVASLTVVILLAGSCSKEKPTVTPQRRTITQAVYASGKIFPVGFTRVASKVPGIVETLLVKPGDTVVKGQPLLRIRAVSSELAVESAQTIYGLARENAQTQGAVLGSVAADLESARERLELDSLNAARLRRLLSQQAVAQATFDAAQAQYEISRRQYTKALDVYSATRQKLAAEQRTAELNVSIQRSLRDEFVLTAVDEGRVYDVIPKVGELVMPQQPLIELGHSRLVEVELSVDEADVALVAVGQSIVFSLDAFKGRTFNGSVVSITPRVSNQDKTASVTARIDSEGARLLPGMSLEANIVIDRRERALVLPREIVPATRILNVRRNGSVQSIRVTTGLEDLRYVEIKGGLNDADEIVP